MPIERSGGGGSSTPSIGSSVLIYRFLVSGAAKASIDTGVDATQAGSNDWTNCDLLEIFFYGRVDNAVINRDTAIIFNNDTGANYDEHWNRVVGIANSFLSQTGNTVLDWQMPGASASASAFGTAHMAVFNPTGTTGFKSIHGIFGFDTPGDTGNNQTTTVSEQYRSTSALTRMKISVAGGGNFIVGSEMAIYKRLAS